MLNYEQVAQYATQMARAYKTREHVNAEEAEIDSRPRIEYDIPDVITHAGPHNGALIDLSSQYVADKRAVELMKQRDELNEHIKNLEGLMHDNLIPNHWYVFDNVAVINVVWLGRHDNIQWRIDTEYFDDKQVYLQCNLHNMDPIINISEDFRPISPYQWFTRISKRGQ